MENLNVYVDLLMIALAGASLSNFFDDCLQDGMIFSAYGKWLNKEYLRNLEIKQHNDRLTEDIENGIILIQDAEFIEPLRDKFWKKPIGGCIICTNVWITILVALIYYFLNPLFIILSVIGISSTFLKFIIK